LLLRYGIKGLFGSVGPQRIGRLTLLALAMVVTLLGGYRVFLLISGMMVIIMFFLEGLHRTRMVITFLVIIVLCGSGVVLFAEHLPLVIQRSISFLPIELDPTARADAEATLEWRLEMWKIIIPEVPKYLLHGKGFTFSSVDFALTQIAIQKGIYKAYEDTLITGNYHNGILTTIIPFGIWGVIGFFWFAWASFKFLLRNYRQSLPELKSLNRFLLAYFCVRVLVFLLAYGQFDLDMAALTGVVGLGAAINGRRKVVNSSAQNVARKPILFRPPDDPDLSPARA
jgi:hypothetical protein